MNLKKKIEQGHFKLKLESIMKMALIDAKYQRDLYIKNVV